MELEKIHKEEIEKAWSRINRDLEYIIRAKVQIELEKALSNN